MNTNKLLTGTLIGGVAAFLAGWLLFGTLFKTVLADNMTAAARTISKEEPDMFYLILSCLLFALLLTYIFEKWAGVRTAMAGLTAGLTIGFINILGLDLSLFSMTTIFSGIQNILPDVAVNTIYSGIVGTVIGWWLGFKRS